MDNNDKIFLRALCKLLIEIFDGPPGNEAYLLNPGDPGLLRSSNQSIQTPLRRDQCREKRRLPHTSITFTTASHS